MKRRSQIGIVVIIISILSAAAVMFTGCTASADSAPNSTTVEAEETAAEETATEVGTDRSKSGYWLTAYNVFDKPWSHYSVYLMHKNKQTIMVAQYYEEAEPVWNTYTLTDNFDDGHAYLRTELIYNSKTGQFKKGIVTKENMLE